MQNLFIGDSYYNNSYSGINITSSTAGTFDKIISENNTQGGIYISNSEYISILSHFPLFSAYSGPDTRIKDNGEFGVWIEHSDQIGIGAYTTHTLNITGNGFSGAGRALYIYNSTNCVIVGVDTTSSVNIYDNFDNIYVSNPSPMDTDHIFQRVNAYNATGNALYLGWSDKVTVRYSNFYDMVIGSGAEGRGIRLYASDECLFENVSAYNNTHTGIMFTNVLS